MKKKALLLIFMLITIIVWAAPALKSPIDVLQSDGTTLTIRLHGDEHANWRTTLDGALLVNVGSDYFIALVNNDGSLSASNQLAHNNGQRSDLEKSIIANQNRDLFFNTLSSSVASQTRLKEPISMTSTTFPHTGSPRAIVILVEFSDLNFSESSPRASFQDYLNKDDNTSPVDRGNRENLNYRSVRQYFKDMSFGAYTPQFDLFGPVKVSQTMSYYGTGANGVGEKRNELIQEAINIVKDSISNFKDYDLNNDNILDLVYVIYAGYGESYGAPTNTLWPMSFNFSYSLGNGYSTGRCGISNELFGSGPRIQDGVTQAPWICGIGLFVHEFSHCLGLPDFYPTSDAQFPNLTDYDNQGMEVWSVMDYGLYNRSGYCPGAYTSWEREALGWITIPTLSTAKQFALQDVDLGGKDGSIAYRINNDADTSGKEYYIVQNVQDSLWNKYIGGHGMLMYHVNYDSYSFSLMSNSVNNTKGKPRMTVVAADGTLASSYRIGQDVLSGGITNAQFMAQVAGDPYPGTSNVREITDLSGLTNYSPWTGGTLNKPIYNINELNHIVYFDYLNKFSTDGIDSIEKSYTGKDIKIYSIDGRYMGTNLNQLPKGIYILNKKKYIVK